jgi:hypothetical protein
MCGRLTLLRPGKDQNPPVGEKKSRLNVYVIMDIVGNISVHEAGLGEYS